VEICAVRAQLYMKLSQFDAAQLVRPSCTSSFLCIRISIKSALKFHRSRSASCVIMSSTIITVANSNNQIMTVLGNRWHVRARGRIRDQLESEGMLQYLSEPAE